jgi:hypothetical protein
MNNRSTRPPTLAFAAAVIALAGFCQITLAAPASGIVAENTACLGHYKTWKTHAGWKAFAVSNAFVGNNKSYMKTYGKNSQSCGYSWKFSTKQGAINFAMTGCKSELRKSNAGKGASCRVTLTSK